jgi:hypothetical protein
MKTTRKQYDEEYIKFVKEWIETHSISKPPSFTSWKNYYRVNKKA